VLSEEIDDAVGVVGFWSSRVVPNGVWCAEGFACLEMRFLVFEQAPELKIEVEMLWGMVGCAEAFFGDFLSPEERKIHTSYHSISENQQNLTT
jgi:hypothetical protein